MITRIINKLATCIKQRNCDYIINYVCGTCARFSVVEYLCAISLCSVG